MIGERVRVGLSKGECGVLGNYFEYLFIQRFGRFSFGSYVNWIVATQFAPVDWTYGVCCLCVSSVVGVKNRDRTSQQAPTNTADQPCTGREASDTLKMNVIASQRPQNQAARIRGENARSPT